MPRYVIDPADLKFVMMSVEERCAELHGMTTKSTGYLSCVRGAELALEEMEGIVKPHKPAGRTTSMNGRRKRRK